MSEAIAVASGKGGVGKTSVVAGVASCLAAMGSKVLCIDADIGLRNLDIVLGLSDKTALDFGDILRGNTTIEKAMVPHSDIKNLYLINAPYTFPDVDDRSFAEMIEIAKTKFEYCFIDCAAGLGRYLRLAAAAADRAIIVTTPDTTSLRDAALTVELLEELGVKRMGLVVNRVRPRLVEREESPNVDDAMDIAGVSLLGVVPEDERVISSSNHAKPIIMRAADGAALAYYNIARRIRGESIPLMRIR